MSVKIHCHADHALCARIQHSNYNWSCFFRYTVMPVWDLGICFETYWNSVLGSGCCDTAIMQVWAAHLADCIKHYNPFGIFLTNRWQIIAQCTTYLRLPHCRHGTLVQLTTHFLRVWALIKSAFPYPYTRAPVTWSLWSLNTSRAFLHACAKRHYCSPTHFPFLHKRES